MDKPENLLRSKKIIHELEEIFDLAGKTGTAVYYYMLASTIEKSAKKAFGKRKLKEFILFMMNDN